jgi:hypothetical protein
MTELGFGMLADIALNLLPIIPVVLDPFRVGANRKKPLR